MSKITHLDNQGRARMVDVGDKDISHREARAAARVLMNQETLALLLENKAPKGDVLASARIAGIMAAKKTSDLIPLCHPLPITAVGVNFETSFDPPSVLISTSAKTEARTGIEMEVLTAASVAALTIYDMLKGIDRYMRITDVRLTYKAGGKSGTFEAD